MEKNLQLYGFNNLTKSLSFNIYDISYARTDREKAEYIEYIDEQYNSERLTRILRNLTEIIGAHILNLSKQDYEPQGASVNILIADGPLLETEIDPTNNRGILEVPPASITAHLDTSHVSVHTFPESHPSRPVSTFRVDIDVSTCGRVTPLAALDYLIASFDSDIISVDYRVRGFTRDTAGRKYFLDYPVRSIQDFIGPETLSRYNAMDVNVYHSNLFHTRMMVRDIDLDDYIFSFDLDQLTEGERDEIRFALEREMLEIYNGSNIFE
ncbi:MAG TPA: adenosylmethionine decarboxylase [Bacillota bacterium]|nr:adenosylmethionine decarboxylase [Fastidiosipila sp.]HPX93666.1 adenosylmethionine decarboxylase [Bacillota bacterium]HQB81430.1 adenosylmethionine decarboxylase [Bacillota bacterium]